MSHTRLPWCWKEEGMLIKHPMVYREDGEAGVMVSDIVASVFGPADAEFIVKACNSHEELVDILKNLVKDIDDWEQAVQQIINVKRVYPWGNLERARAVIKAENQ